MLRAVVGSVAVLAVCAGSLLAADDQNKATKDHAKKATITKVDSKNGTITVRMPDKNGKETERTFRLTEDVRMVDSNGRVAAIDVFQSGDEVLVVEEEGRLREIHKSKAGTNTRNPADKSGRDKTGGR
jgi:hypothetical protein